MEIPLYPNVLTQCRACRQICRAANLAGDTDIPDFLSRLVAGEEVPAGECLNCGCLSYLLKLPVPETKATGYSAEMQGVAARDSLKGVFGGRNCTSCHKGWDNHRPRPQEKGWLAVCDPHQKHVEVADLPLDDVLQVAVAENPHVLASAASGKPRFAGASPHPGRTDHRAPGLTVAGPAAMPWRPANTRDPSLAEEHHSRHRGPLQELHEIRCGRGGGHRRPERPQRIHQGRRRRASCSPGR